MDCSLPGSSVLGILQARILEWAVIPFSGYLPDPGIEPGSPTWQADSLPSELPGKLEEGFSQPAPEFGSRGHHWAVLKWGGSCAPHRPAHSQKTVSKAQPSLPHLLVPISPGRYGTAHPQGRMKVKVRLT